jgi:hypothetical protein
MANNITDIIHKATDATVLWIKQRAKQVPWWHPELNKIKKQLHHAK